MGAHSFQDLITHVGHDITCVTYGEPAQNVAIECEECCEVLLDFDEEPEPVIPMSATQLISEQELFEQFKDWKNFGFPNDARMLYQLELATRKITDMTARLKRVYEAARLIQQHNDGAALDVIIMLSEGGYKDVQ